VRVRLFVSGTVLCDAEGADDEEAFDAVLDGVAGDPRVHRSEIEALEIDSAEVASETEPLASVDVGEMAEKVLSLPAISEEQTREQFESEHGLDVFDCSTWPDDIVKDMVHLLAAWARGDRANHDYEVIVIARGLDLIGRDDENALEEITDRGRLLLLGRRAGKQGW
jgi:hypothetical protein